MCLGVEEVIAPSYIVHSFMHQQLKSYGTDFTCGIIQNY